MYGKLSNIRAKKVVQFSQECTGSSTLHISAITGLRSRFITRAASSVITVSFKSPRDNHWII